MNISNLTEFSNFINSNGFNTLDSSFSGLSGCLSKYAAKCGCYKKEDKLAQYNICNQLYYSIVSGVVPRYKSQILQKTGNRNIYFYDNSRLIGSIGY